MPPLECTLLPRKRMKRLKPGMGVGGRRVGVALQARPLPHGCELYLAHRFYSNADVVFEGKPAGRIVLTLTLGGDVGYLTKSFENPNSVSSSICIPD